MLSLEQCQNKKEYKMIAPTEDVREAGVFAKESFEDDLIPVFQANSVEVTFRNDSKMIVYCEHLEKTQDKCKVGEKEEKGLCIIKLSGDCAHEEFACTNLVEAGENI